MIKPLVLLSDLALDSVIETQILTVQPESFVLDVIKSLYSSQKQCLLSFLSESPGNYISDCVIVADQSGIFQGLLPDLALIRSLLLNNSGQEAIAPLITDNQITITSSDVEDVFGLLSLFNQYHCQYLPIIDEKSQLTRLLAIEELCQQLQLDHLLALRQVEQVMTREVLTTDVNTSLWEVAQLLVTSNVKTIVITDEQTPLGLITTDDLLQIFNLELDWHRVLAHQVMNVKIIYVSEQESLLTVYHQLRVRPHQDILVCNQRQNLVGTINFRNLLQIIQPKELYSLATSLQQQITQLQALPERNIQQTELAQQLAVCQSSYQQQSDQERLLGTIALKVLQSLDLDEILKTTVREVRQLLNTDRVLIYRFDGEEEGSLIAASASYPGWSLDARQVQILSSSLQWQGVDLDHEIEAIADISHSELTPEQQQLLGKLKVKAHLTIPLVESLPELADELTINAPLTKLWGLLILQQCSRPRNWQRVEIEFLQQLTTQVIIAIQQAELYQQAQIELKERRRAETDLKQLNETLENRVKQRMAQLKTLNHELLAEIEERKHIEQVLRESEERLYRIISTNQDGLVVINPEGQVRFVNPAAANLFGRQQEDLIGHILGLPIVNEKVTELEILHIDGKLLTVEMRVVAIPWEGQNAYLASLRNISDRKQAEYNLIQSQQRYQELINSIEAIVWEIELTTNQQTFISPTVEKLLGYPVNNYLNEPDFWQQRIHPDDREAVLTVKESALQAGQDYELEYRMLASNGTVVWVRDLVTVIVEQQQAIKLRGLTVDITNQKQIEIALRESQTRLKLLNYVAQQINSGMSVEQIIEITIQQISEYFPKLKVAYSSVDEHGYVVTRCCRQPSFMPSLKDVGFDLGATPEIWRILDMGEPVISEDISGDQRFNAIMDILSHNGTKAILQLPILELERLSGIISFASATIKKWSDYERVLLQDVAEYLSVVIKETEAQQQRLQAQNQLVIQSQKLTEFSDNLKELHRLNTTNYPQLDDLLADYLATGCRIFKLGNGIISNINGEDYLILATHGNNNQQFTAGDVLKLSDTYCQVVVKQQKTLAQNQISKAPHLHHIKAWQQCNINAYLGTPIVVNNKIYGSLCFFEAKTRSRPFESYQIEILELMAQSLSKMIANTQIAQEQKQTLEQLESNQRFVQRITETIPNFLYIYDLEQETIIYHNQEATSILGYSTPEMGKLSSGFFSNLIHPEDLPKVKSSYQQLEHLLDGSIIENEYRIKHKNGEWRWLYSRDLLFSQTSDGKTQQILGVATDISRQKRIEQELQEANYQLTTWVQQLEQQHREITLLGEMSEVLQSCLTLQEAYNTIPILVEPLFPQSCGAVFIISNKNNIVESVATWGELLNTETFFTINQCWALRRGRIHWLDSQDKGLVCPHIHQLSEIRGTLCVPMMAQGETLGLFYLSFSQAPELSDAKRQLAITVAEHISLSLANLQLRETLEHQNIRDPLTNLFNRRYMEESLERELKRAQRKQQPLGIIMLDVDHFKRFNDDFGHEAGDIVLKELGLFLNRSIRDSDIACRYGGEELMLILPETSLENSQRRAEQIREGIKHLQVEHRRQTLPKITISMGVAAFPEHGVTGEAIIWAADTALYQAKAQGRDRVVTANF